jgi:HTH-type transcriptional regulator/antitoxin HigA
MAKIVRLMNKGRESVSLEEQEEIKQLALAAQGYERQKYTVSPPKTLVGTIDMRMYEMQVKG